MRKITDTGLLGIGLFLLFYTFAVAENKGKVLLDEKFEEKNDGWKVLKQDVGNGFLIDKGALNIFGSLNWQFKIPFANHPISGLICRFRYKVVRSKDDQCFIVGLGLAPHLAAVALNASNLSPLGVDGWKQENKGLAAEKGKWHSVRIILNRLGDNTFDVYLNGDPVKLKNPLLAQAKTINCVSMWTKPNKRGSLGEWYIDDLMVSVGPLPVASAYKLIDIWGQIKGGKS